VYFYYVLYQWWPDRHALTAALKKAI